MGISWVEITKICGVFSSLGNCYKLNNCRETELFVLRSVSLSESCANEFILI